MPTYQAWREVFAEQGLELPVQVYVDLIGQSSITPLYELYERWVGPSDRAALEARARTRYDAMIAEEPLLPGVHACLEEARGLGLRLGVASSSSRAWVIEHLARRGIDGYFACISCRDDVEASKPDPACYLRALDRLGVSADEAVALEDSPKGILAAKRAGLRCVAVPSRLTADLDLSLADVRLSSLTEMSLSELLARLDRRP